MNCEYFELDSKKRYVKIKSLQIFPKKLLGIANCDLNIMSERNAVDINLIISTFRAQEELFLIILKHMKPNESVISTDYKYGYIHNQQPPITDLDVERMILQRQEYKMQRKYKEADAVRKTLENWGYSIRDTNSGTDWIFQP